VLALSSCTADNAGPSEATSSSGYRGDQLGQPVALSVADQSAVFTSTSGGTATLASLNTGRLMLLYFGYTHCPDVCPTTMADLGQALRQLPTQIQSHVQVVFVTSDPARDTAPVMKAWLNNFDPQLLTPFVGLTASLKQIDAVATSVGVPLSPPVTEPDGTISVEHGAQTLAFVNGKASVLWLAGTAVPDYVHDISSLAETLSPS
jgi:protein SCO1/2